MNGSLRAMAHDSDEPVNAGRADEQMTGSVNAKLLLHFELQIDTAPCKSAASQTA
jgi:hypothetical protein